MGKWERKQLWKRNHNFNVVLSKKLPVKWMNQSVVQCNLWLQIVWSLCLFLHADMVKMITHSQLRWRILKKYVDSNNYMTKISSRINNITISVIEGSKHGHKWPLFNRMSQMVHYCINICIHMIFFVSHFQALARKTDLWIKII